jgi:enamine deaminase RidA (YjgF/YER057c/UK114 family)
MDQRRVNPWTWQDRYGFSQAIEVTGGERVLYCAGQTSTGTEGETLHGDDMGAQCRQALDNLMAVLEHAGMTLANVVRLNYYVTDVDRFLAEGAPVAGERLGAAGVQPAGTLLGISRLAFPGLLIELEATAVA